MVGLDQSVIDALASVHDPCSIAAGRPTSLIDMGLVLGWTLEKGTLTVTFGVTFAGCTMAPHFTAAAARELVKLPGVDRVETVVDTSHIWTPPAPAPMRGEPQAWRSRSKGSQTGTLARRRLPVSTSPGH